MSNDEQGNITPFPVRKREAATDEPFLKRVVYNKACLHEVGYIVDTSEAEVTCAACYTKLNPIWVLEQMAINETRWHRNQKYNLEAIKRLQERSRTKCQHCGQLTRISHR